jgi:hypothetical protein
MRLEIGEDSRHSKGEANTMEVRRTNETTKKKQTTTKLMGKVGKGENKMVRTVDGA